MKCLSSVIGGVFLLHAPIAYAQLGLPSAVNPATYESPSGALRLEVDPGEIYGSGGAEYRLSRRGAVVWSGPRPFTLLSAGITDEGVVVGYSYSGGLLGDDGTEVHFVILSESGATRLDDAIPREMSQVIDGGPEPNVVGMILNPENDEVVFRVSNVTGPEIWRTYQLSSGRALARFTPKAPQAGEDVSQGIVDARPIRGTPLILVHWSTQDWKKELRGAAFSLVDGAGKTVWALNLAADHRMMDDPKADLSVLTDEVAKTGISVTDPASFELRRFATAERVAYAVEESARGVWSVREIQRAPYVSKAVTPPPPLVEKVRSRDLKSLGSITLGSSASVSPTRGVHEFDIDEGGRIAFARAEPACEVVFVQIVGDASRETPLGTLGQKECYRPLVAWAGGDTWLVTQEFAQGGGPFAGWWVDAARGESRPFTLPSGVSVHAVAGRKEGGVIVLGQMEKPVWSGAVIETIVQWIATDNRKEREFTGEGEDNRGWFLPNDVTVTTTGDVALIETVGHTVTLLDPAGHVKATVDLKKQWKSEPNYPSGISADTEGGFIVEDSGGPVPFVRMSRDGKVRGELRPSYPDGQPAGSVTRIRVAPDGTLWAADGEALLRLDAVGQVTSATGPSASPSVLGEVADWVVDGADNIYAADRRTGAVHVFNREGVLLRVCPRGPSAGSEFGSPEVAVTAEGVVMVRIESGPLEDESFLEFSPDCKTSTRRLIPAKSLRPNLATGDLWAVGWQDITLLGKDRGRVKTVSRRLDRRWLETISNAVAGPDGSLAVASTGGGGLPSRVHEWVLNVFASDGTPKLQVSMPAAADRYTLGYDARRLAYWQGDAVRVRSLGDGLVTEFKPARVGSRSLGLMIAAAGRELWILDRASKVVQRYEMP